MTTTRGNVVLTDHSRFEVLGLVSIALPGPWWWHTEDLNETGAVGAIFRCYDRDNQNELAYLLVADLSSDQSEPDISAWQEVQASDFDRFLEREIRDRMMSDGREFIRWMSSHLNRGPLGTCLLTAYVARDQGRERQYMDLRARVRDRNICVGACFDIAHAKELSAPIMSALFDARPQLS
jgi:hypothetical protein